MYSSLVYQWFFPVVTVLPLLLLGQASKGTSIGAPLIVAASPIQVRQESPVVCPVMGKNILSPEQAWKTRDIKGVRYFLCCEVCEKQFDKDSSKFTTAPSDPMKAGGVFLFDPVTTKRLDLAQSVAYSVYGGVVYPFAKRYAARPEKELLYCPVSDKAVKDYASASDYSDYEGERIYFCCPGCKGQFDKEPTKYKAQMDARRAKLAEPKTEETPSNGEGA